jgi:hypothetical protein
MPASVRRAARLLAGTVACLLVLAGCGGGSSGGDGVTITQGERSPAIEGAQARFAAPADSAVVDSSSVDVTVEVQSFETGVQTETPRREEIANSANGQHVHIILDNDPYMANYEPGQPFPIGDLEPGPHTAVVFPSRSYHESVKNEGAHDVVNFYVGEEEGEFMLDPSQPTIIYSRPKGSYSGAAAERIMLDFYLHNVELSADGYRARYTIREAGGQEPLATTTVSEWAPSFVTGLESGTYVVRLELIDGDGNVVPGAFNTTEREIEVSTEGADASDD